MLESDDTDPLFIFNSAVSCTLKLWFSHSVYIYISWVCLTDPFSFMHIYSKTLKFFIACSLLAIVNRVNILQALLSIYTQNLMLIHCSTLFSHIFCQQYSTYVWMHTTFSTARQYMSHLVWISRKQKLKYIRMCLGTIMTYYPCNTLKSFNKLNYHSLFHYLIVTENRSDFKFSLNLEVQMVLEKVSIHKEAQWSNG